MTNRCTWCGDEPIYINYHDREWGVPLHDERRLFELLCLEGAQAGLSWITILKKRDGYREAFDNFDTVKIAGYTETDIERLKNDIRIVRNRLKIESVIKNAQSLLELYEQGESLESFLWKYVDGTPIQNSWTMTSELPSSTAVSEQMSRDLKKRGFKFVGPTICYALMQSIGMVNDHLVGCYRYKEVRAMGA
ncbi:DNA-3-methyladenine glycosylase I [Desulforhopalus sp. IMCC35007]|uniref:DNA-3-methyladenine glycosylase I n=1 Tax=Desulforhopalus sp. IMCC35007 TaxID=2569543 RepID=UPI0010AEBFA4|nr:DNA-3-methyladenine glycosylase I [Desulforhopalus sp. IMCC35007]TKB07137.1 DNA-3-methyladenine glycosylase I [Desulforhopalus sp. IMCC35007]